MTIEFKAMIRSFVTTLVSTFLAAVPVAALTQGDFSWAVAAGVSALVAAIRTTIAAVDPGMPLFGNGSEG